MRRSTGPRGSKSKPWQRREQLTFVNSDEDVILVYLAWLDVLGVERDRRSFRVMIHESADVEASERYWAGVAGVPVASLLRTTLKRHKPKTPRKNTGDLYHGCLVVKVSNAMKDYWRMESVWSELVAALGGPSRRRMNHDKL